MDSIINLGNTSLWEIIRGGCFPVTFFLMLSGYGLRYVYENGDNHHFGRIIKLYIHYWAILLVFVSIGFFKVGADLYPGDWMRILKNVSSFHTSYNYECWFILPFVLISASYPILFRVYDKLEVVLLLLACLVYFGCGYVISHFHLIYKTAPHALYNFIQFFFIMLPFLFGAMLKKHNLCERLKQKIGKHKYFMFISWGVIAVVLIAKTLIQTTAFDPFFAFMMFASIWQIINGHKCNALQLIGKHSMNIWMIHTFFIHYLFHNELYSLEFTILVYTATLLLSLMSSYFIDLFTSRIDKCIYSCKL